MGTVKQYYEELKVKAKKLAKEIGIKRQRKSLIYQKTHWEAG